MKLRDRKRNPSGFITNARLLKLTDLDDLHQREAIDPSTERDLKELISKGWLQGLI